MPSLKLDIRCQRRCPGPGLHCDISSTSSSVPGMIVNGIALWAYSCVSPASGVVAVLVVVRGVGGSALRCFQTSILCQAKLCLHVQKTGVLCVYCSSHVWVYCARRRPMDAGQQRAPPSGVCVSNKQRGRLLIAAASEGCGRAQRHRHRVPVNKRTQVRKHLSLLVTQRRPLDSTHCRRTRRVQGCCAFAIPVLTLWLWPYREYSPKPK
jgi:hypothetical protein